MTVKMAATVDLPEPMPPVSPILSMEGNDSLNYLAALAAALLICSLISRLMALRSSLI